MVFIKSPPKGSGEVNSYFIFQYLFLLLALFTDDAVKLLVCNKTIISYICIVYGDSSKCQMPKSVRTQFFITFQVGSSCTNVLVNMGNLILAHRLTQFNIYPEKLES